MSQRVRRQPGFQNQVLARLKLVAGLRVGRRAAPLSRCLPATDLVTCTKPWRVVWCELMGQSQYCAPFSAV